ncbi:MAG: hypothetical protein ACOCYT_03500 [Chloroflexota bacterium]
MLKNRRRLWIGAAALTVIVIAAGALLLTDSVQPDAEGFTRPTATARPFAATVRLTHPLAGAIIYAESLIVQGETVGSPQRFAVELVDIDGTTLARAALSTQPGAWSIELPHGFRGDPVEASLRLVPEQPGVTGEYDRVTLLLSTLDQRPEGPILSVGLPSAGDRVGGDTIPVEGRASGGSTLTLTLTDASDTLLDQQMIILTNPYRVDDLPWTASVSPGAYTGPALLTVQLDDAANAPQTTIPLEIGAAAG